jgi:U3 small nucleolar RNA-associated protein 13
LPWAPEAAMASSSTYVLKKNYRCDRSLQQFYTGGPFALGLAPGGDGEGGAEAEAFLACACGGEVRVVSRGTAGLLGPGTSRPELAYAAGR